MLECKLFKERHTGCNLEAAIREMCNDWAITEKIVAITSDNAKNIKSAIKFLEKPHISCFAHNLHLAVKEGLPEIKETRTKIKTIVDKYKKSNLFPERLKAMQQQFGESQLSLKQDTPTRWNSTYLMFSRILEVQKSLMSVMTLHYQELPTITSEDFQIITETCELLKIFDNATTTMSSEKKVTISQVIFLYRSLDNKCATFLQKDGLSKQVKKMAINIRNDLTTKRFKDIETDEIYTHSTILDPRLKKHGFKSPEKYEEAVITLKNVLEQVSTT